MSNCPTIESIDNNENEEFFTFFPYSDLHLEFSEDILKDELFVQFPRNTEYMVLLGDMSTLASLADMPEERRTGIPPDRRLFEFLRIQAEKGYKKIFYICGNHEFYLSEYFEVMSRLEAIFKELGELFKDPERFIFLHEMNPSVILDKNGNLVSKESDDGVLRVIGCCQWSNVPELHKFIVTLMLRDFQVIKIDKKQLEEMGKQFGLTAQPHKVPLALATPDAMTVEDQALLYNISMKQIEKEMEEANAKKQTVLILTHNAPLLLDGMSSEKAKSIGSQSYFEPKVNRIVELSGLKHAFHNSLEDFFQKYDNLYCWAYGHTHCSYRNTNYHGTEIVNNTVGYYFDKNRFQNFNPNLEIKIPKDPQAALEKIAAKRVAFQENLKKQSDFVKMFKK